jgi:adenosylhomocysteine nucleosidase
VSADEQSILHGNEVFRVEVRGFDHIPEPERNMTLRQVDSFWVANSVNLLSFALGALAIGRGLDLRLALAACVVGSIAYAYLAFGSIIAVRAGLPVSTLSRAAFGMRGNFPNALLSWVVSVVFEVINTIFGVEAILAALRLLGWSDPGPAGKLLAVLLQLVLCGGIAVLGHATMIWFQRIFAVLVSGALGLVMVFVFMAGRIHLGAAAGSHGALSTGATLAAFLTACGAIASNPLSFLFNGPDWVRYLPSATPARSVFQHVFWASFLPSVALGAMGAIGATLGDMSDPVAGLRPFIPEWLFIIYILAVIGGSLANTVPTYYSSGLSLQALGLKLHRNLATAVDVVVSTAIALYVLFVQDFSTALDDFIALLVVWVGPFGGVWVCDGYLRRGTFDFAAIHSKAGAAGRYWGWQGLNVPGCIALTVGMVAAALTMRSPLFDGPLATALGGADLSWIVGFPASALVYRVLNGSKRMNIHRLVIAVAFGCLATLSGAAAEAETLDTTPRTAVMSAFEPEWTALQAMLVGREEHVVQGIQFLTGTIEKQPVVLFLSGVSMVNAAMTTQMALDRFTIRRIVFSGIAGGVNPQLRVGDVTVPDEWSEYLEAVFARETSDGYRLPPYAEKSSEHFGMIFTQPIEITLSGQKREKRRWFPVDAQLLGVARSVAGSVVLKDCTSDHRCLQQKPHIVIGGNGVSGAVFVDNTKYREYVYKTFAANVLDQESASVAHVAYVNKTPFIAFRSLSDLAGGGQGENEMATFFQLASDNSAVFVRAFLKALPAPSRP